MLVAVVVGKPASSVPMRSSCAAQEGRVTGPLAQQQVAEPVHQQDAGAVGGGAEPAARLRRPAVGAARRAARRRGCATTAGIRSASVSRPYCGAVRLVPGHPGATGGGGGQRAGEVQRPAQRLLAVGVRGDPQRDVVGAGRAGVAVVRLAVRVGAAGRLEVEPADAAPADGQRQLARALARPGRSRGCGDDVRDDHGLHRGQRDGLGGGGRVGLLRAVRRLGGVVVGVHHDQAGAR